MEPPQVLQLKMIYVSFEMLSPSIQCPVNYYQLLVCSNPSFPTTYPDQNSQLIFVYVVAVHLVVFRRTLPACTSGGNIWVIVSSVLSAQRGRPDGGHPGHTLSMCPRPILQPPRSRSGYLPPTLTNVRLWKPKQQPLNCHLVHFSRKSFSEPFSDKTSCTWVKAYLSLCVF